MTQYRNTEIEFRVGEKSVRHHHTGKRWPPTPRSNASVMEQFGYAEVRYISANGARMLTHERAENIDGLSSGGGIESEMSKTIGEEMNYVFGTEKFSGLRLHKDKTGRGRDKKNIRENYVCTITTDNGTYSEANLSLGELLVLNTLFLIQRVPDDSLLLIDEIEMALHPLAQRRFFELLSDRYAQKD